MSDDKRHDQHTRQRVEEIGDGFGRHVDRLDSFTTRVGRVLWGMVAAMVILAVFTTINVRDIHAQAARIQDERARNIRSNCQAQNERHDDTLSEARRRLADRRQRNQLELVVSLVDTLAPVRDCDRLVRAQVQGAS